MTWCSVRRKKSKQGSFSWRLKPLWTVQSWSSWNGGNSLCVGAGEQLKQGTSFFPQVIQISKGIRIFFKCPACSTARHLKSSQVGCRVPHPWSLQFPTELKIPVWLSHCGIQACWGSSFSQRKAIFVVLWRRTTGRKVRVVQLRKVQLKNYSYSNQSCSRSNPRGKTFVVPRSKLQ